MGHQGTKRHPVITTIYILIAGSEIPVVTVAEHSRIYLNFDLLDTTSPRSLTSFYDEIQVFMNPRSA